jgi:hypothetical protein
MLKHPFEAVIFDLDGVITKTAATHSHAWKKMFDDYLRYREEKYGEPFREFTSEDYLHYVDGKPRYDGVKSFLDSRGIDIPYGSPEDTPDMETVCGLGNRKNNAFNEVLRKEGVEVYPSTVKLMERLKKDGLWESTIVVWTTDHGDCLPRAKRDLTDSGLEVPMIIYWPEAYRPGGVKPGTVDSRLISFVDLAPTFLDIAGAPIPDYMQGISLLSDSVRQYIYAAKDRMDEVYYRQRAVRDTAYKYIRSWYPQVPDGSHIAFRDNIEMMRQMWVMLDKGELSPEQRLWFEPTGEERLYDLKKDPLELHNVAGDTAYAAVLKRMRGALDDWLGRIGDWSEVTEDEMVKRFYPDGERPVTPAPQVTRDGDLVVVTCPEEGASLGYRLDEGPWQLYTGPVHVPEGHAFAARAVRYGWQESGTAVLGQSSPK